MATPQREPERGGDVIGTTRFSCHKAASLEELVDAGLNGMDRSSRMARPPRRPRISPSVILAILGIICVIASFAAYDHMLNVRARINLLDPNTEYDELVSVGGAIARTAAY